MRFNQLLAPVRALSPSPRQLLLAVAVAVSLGGLWWSTLERSQFEIAEAQADEASRNDRLVLAHEHQARLVLRTLDQALQSITDDPALVEGLLAGRSALPRHLVLRGIRVGLADTTGRRAGDDMDLPSGWTDRLLAHHRASDRGQPYVQVPQREPTGQGWVTTLSRALVDRDGRLTGVIYSRMDPRAFLEFFDNASLRPADMIGIAGQDARLRARRSGGTYHYDDVLPDARLLGGPERRPQGHFVVPSAIDGTRRFYSFRAMPDYGLVALVGTAYDGVMAPVQERVHRYVAVATGVSLFLVVGALMLLLAIRRHERAASELRRGERRFRALTEMSADWFWETGEDLRLTEVVRARRNQDPGLELTVGLLPWEMPRVQGEPAHWEAHRATLERREPFADFEVRSTDAKGRPRVALISGEPIIDSRGRFRGYRGVGHDVTEQRAAEQAQRASEARLAGIIESAMDAIITVDARHRVVVFNAAAAQMFRCTPQQALGEPLEKFIPERFRAHHGEQMRGYARTHDTPRTMGRGRHIWGLRADGQEFPADASISHAEVGDTQLFSVVLRDITARLAAEATLRDREESYRLLFENNLDGLLLADEAGAVNRANPAASGLLGRSLDEILRAGLSVLEGAGNPLREALDACRREGHARGEFLVRRPDGTERRLEVAFAAYQDSSGRHRSSVLLHDVTERHLAQAAQEALANQLRQSQKMEALGSIAGGIAHDFNNVIAAILGNARLAQDNLASVPVASVYLKEIARAGLRARELVKRIMTFSRKQPAVFARQPLGPVVREAVALLRATLPSGVSITLRGEDTPGEVLADATQVHQVVMNLGTNAWQAMRQRTGRIDITLEPVEGEPSVRLSVQDNGSGMDEATQARIFEPFFTTKPDGEGTGLGLSVVQRIVHAHQGTISVNSQPGAGCRFDIVLPLAQGDAGTAGASQPAPAEVASDALPMPELQAAPVIPEPVPGTGDGTRRHIVYVDDYEAMVAMVMAVLEAQGFRVSGFDSSPRALEFMRQHSHEVDMLITDYNMPEMSGLDLARETKALRPGLPIIVASGHLSADLRAGAVEVGVDCLFDKPAGIDEMCRRINELLPAA